jgi:deoxyribose-phosphate aldolase
MATYHIETYGCTSNRGESRQIERKLRDAGHCRVDGPDEADVAILNTCTVVEKTERNMLRRAEELERVVAAVPVPVKIIVEAPLLAEDELRTACELAADADADYVKTATGFAEGGAEVADVEVMSDYLPVKASGGIGSFEAAVEMLAAGADRIGASSGVAIVEGYDAELL